MINKNNFFTIKLKHGKRKSIKYFKNKNDLNVLMSLLDSVLIHYKNTSKLPGLLKVNLESKIKLFLKLFFSR